MAGLIRLCEGQAKGLHDHNVSPPPFTFHITGVGKEKATAGVMALMDAPEKPDAILSLGFAGGLHSPLATGDLVLSRRLYATGESAFIEADPRLLQAAQEALAEAHLSRRGGEAFCRRYPDIAPDGMQGLGEGYDGRRHRRMDGQHGRLLDRAGSPPGRYPLPERQVGAGYCEPGCPALHGGYWRQKPPGTGPSGSGAWNSQAPEYAAGRKPGKTGQSSARKPGISWYILSKQNSGNRQNSSLLRKRESRAAEGWIPASAGMTGWSLATLMVIAHDHCRPNNEIKKAAPAQVIPSPLMGED